MKSELCATCLQLKDEEGSMVDDTSLAEIDMRT